MNNTILFGADKGISGEIASKLIDDEVLTLPPQKTYRNKRRKELRRFLYNLIHARSLTKARDTAVKVALPLREINQNNCYNGKVSYSGLKAVMSDLQESGYLYVNKGSFFVNCSKEWKEACLEDGNLKNRCTEVWGTRKLNSLIDDYLRENTDVGADVDLLVTSTGVEIKDKEGQVVGSVEKEDEVEKVKEVDDATASAVTLSLPLSSLVSSISVRTSPLRAQGGASSSLSTSSLSLPSINVRTSPPVPYKEQETAIDKLHNVVVHRIGAAWSWKHRIEDGRLVYEVPEEALSNTRKYVRGSWNKGGRFYNDVQNVPSDWRKHLRIEGEEVVELDYDNLHFNMLYAKEGEELEGDAYKTTCNLLEELARDVNKTTANVMLNARSPQALYGCLKNNIDWKEEVGVSIPDEAFKPLVNALRDRHEPIKECFHSDVGVSLQYEDSRLAYEVITETGGTLGVHDGFVAKKSKEQELRKNMKEAFRSEYGQDISVSSE
ncbi:hypothetical protein [Salinibacter grassmerensis]|uniref:hypothetical protein n=1 Tax=Salinibacter grassmerensis TaxID=3040353 RepID=UPI0021E7C1DA|nr:hypothetical protein [Salinibacter grassmerensis]